MSAPCGSALLANSSLTVGVANPGGATLSCEGISGSAPFTGTVAGGGDLTSPFVQVCHYSDMADGAVISASLNVKYTINGFERSVSGSPATIRFTVQSD